MVAVRPEHAHEMAGDPPVFAVGCEGRMSDVRRLPDGRFNVLLQGTQRFRIRAEPPRAEGRLYRVAEIERLEDPFDPAARPRVIALRQRALEIVTDLLAAGSAERAFGPDAFREVDDVTFVNALANAFAFAPAEKQGLLEAASILERYECLVSLLAFQAAERGRPASPAPGAVH
jgi:hypothetical protein